MGRRPEGYKIRKRGRIWFVRFTHDRRSHEYSTGQETRAEADRVARAIYAAVLRGEAIETQQRGGARPQLGGRSLSEVTDQWLTEHSIRPSTLVLYRKYSGYWVKHFGTLAAMTDKAIGAYCRQRLREVRGKTAGSEMAAMRAFVGWCVEVEFLRDAPDVPHVSKQIAGTPYKHRRRAKAPELSPVEIERILDELPEKAARGWLVKSRFIVAYDTTLRPETLSRLRVPENWSKGCEDLTITNEDDKELYGRTVPLTERARKTLERVAPDEGLIFGEHRAVKYLRDAAKQVLPESKAAIFTGQHFRSAAITHLLELTGNVPGVQGLAGHKHTSTTSRYVRPTLRAAREVQKLAESKRVIVGQFPGQSGKTG